MPKNLSVVDLKINEIIDILMLHPESEALPENYRELGEHLARFKLQNSQDSLRAIRSMINTLEINRELEEGIDKFGDKSLDDEAERLSADYNQKYYKERKNSFSCSHSTLTAVEQNVVLGLMIKIKKDTGGYSEAFLTTMQDTLKFVGFSTPQVWEVMTQHLNPESQRFQSAEIQHILGQDFDTHEYN
jgi:hypothetical protein